MSYRREILDEDFEKKVSFLESTHILLYISILIITFQILKLYHWADPGFYLPNGSIFLSVIPETFISSIDRYETRIEPISIFIITSVYLFLLGVFYQIIRDKFDLRLKALHIFITASLVIVFFFFMIDSELVHEAIDSNILQSNYFDKRYSWFYWLFIFWILVQLIIPIAHLRMWIETKK